MTKHELRELLDRIEQLEQRVVVLESNRIVPPYYHPTSAGERRWEPGWPTSGCTFTPLFPNSGSTR
jgi:hypothetical protein